MRFINEIFVLKPAAIFSNFDTGEKFVAEDVCRERQLSECAKSPLLPYEKDPVFISICAVVAGEPDDSDIVFRDTNMPISHLLWEGPDGNVYMTDLEAVQAI